MAIKHSVICYIVLYNMQLYRFQIDKEQFCNDNRPRLSAYAVCANTIAFSFW